MDICNLASAACPRSTSACSMETLSNNGPTSLFADAIKLSAVVSVVLNCNQINQSFFSLFVHMKVTNQMKSHTPIALQCMSKEHSSYSSPPHTQWATVFWPLSNNQAILKGCTYLLSQAYPCIIIMELIHYLHQISKYFLHNQSKWWLPWFHQFKTH